MTTKECIYHFMLYILTVVCVFNNQNDTYFFTEPLKHFNFARNMKKMRAEQFHVYYKTR